MSLLRYIIQSLLFFRKQHLAVFAGTVVSTAVLTGALVVGDSVKLSLKDLVGVRLGKTTHVMQTGDRFIGSHLAEDLANDLNRPVAALLMLDGIAIDPDADVRVNAVQVIGIDERISSFFEDTPPAIDAGEALVSRNLADKLQLDVADEFLLRLEDASIIPLNAPFAQDAQASVGVRLKVKKVLADGGMGRFSLENNQAAPFNVFADRDYIAGELGLGNRVNRLLVADAGYEGSDTARLTEAFRRVWKAADMGISILHLDQAQKIEIQSDRIFIDPPVARVVTNAFPQAEPLLTYLVNTMQAGENSTPYSFVTAAGEPYVKVSQPDGITLNQWAAEDLGVNTGDSVRLTYFVVGPLRALKEKSHQFLVGSIIPTAAFPADSTLMPRYPGLSEANNCRDWETGIPIDLNLIRDKDEFYWDDYKGTPKGLIDYSMGVSLWENDFGSLTALRLNDSAISVESLEALLVQEVNPADLNLFFRPVFQQGLNAANNAVDFGELFISLSFFVIVAGVLLTILLFSLYAENRMKESGVLAALGFGKWTIISLRLLESVPVAIAGGIAGSLAGLLYNYGLVLGLNSVWKDAVHTDILQVHTEPATLLAGMFAGAFIGLIAIFLVSLRKFSKPVDALLRGLEPTGITKRRKRPVLTLMTLAGGFTASLFLLLYSLFQTGEPNAGLFLASGGMFLVGMLGALSLYVRNLAVHARVKIPGRMRLAMVNAGRNQGRSITTIALFALGTFTIVITGANRKSFYGAESNRSSGTGGFRYWVETTMPLPYNLQTDEGRVKAGVEENGLLSDTSVVQFMALDGDDASCLNLNQVQQPRILGVDPDDLQTRGAFAFASLYNNIPEDRAWEELKNTYADDVIPAFADQTVITWGLKKKVGDTLHYRNESGVPLKLLLVGGLENSIFQGNLLIAMEHFRKNFPSVSGSSLLLIDSKPGSDGQAAAELELLLADYGISISSSRERLARFNSVENTYLSVFMALGGLGVLIGTIGLGIVLLRNMQERRKELALLNSIGFTRKELIRITLYENGFLLLAGLATGMLAAFIGILPSLLSPAYTIPGVFMAWLLLAVLASGLIWIWIPARKIVRLPLIQALRSE